MKINNLEKNTNLWGKNNLFQRNKGIQGADIFQSKQGSQNGESKLGHAAEVLISARGKMYSENNKWQKQQLDKDTLSENQKVIAEYNDKLMAGHERKSRISELEEALASKSITAEDRKTMEEELSGLYDEEYANQTPLDALYAKRKDMQEKVARENLTDEERSFYQGILDECEKEIPDEICKEFEGEVKISGIEAKAAKDQALKELEGLKKQAETDTALEGLLEAMELVQQELSEDTGTTNENTDVKTSVGENPKLEKVAVKTTTTKTTGEE